MLEMKMFVFAIYSSFTAPAQRQAWFPGHSSLSGRDGRSRPRAGGSLLARVDCKGPLPSTTTHFAR